MLCVNPRETIRLLLNRGIPYAQYNLGVMHRKGDGVPQDYRTALKWYSACRRTGSCRSTEASLGWMHYKGQGVPQDSKTAVKWWALAAEQGDADAQSNLGVMYGTRKGSNTGQCLCPYVGKYRCVKWKRERVRQLCEIRLRKMTSAQIAEAQKLARECVRKKYKGC